MQWNSKRHPSTLSLAKTDLSFIRVKKYTLTTWRFVLFIHDLNMFFFLYRYNGPQHPSHQKHLLHFFKKEIHQRHSRSLPVWKIPSKSEKIQQRIRAGAQAFGVTKESFWFVTKESFWLVTKESFWLREREHKIKRRPQKVWQQEWKLQHLHQQDSDGERHETSGAPSVDEENYKETDKPQSCPGFFG